MAESRLAEKSRLLAEFLSESDSLAVLTGAGVSTASGIPGYRDRNGDWKYDKPIQFGEFVKDRDLRKRYWARSYLGWRRFSEAQPNEAHHALVALESTGKIDTLITQNVDRLHQAAGSCRVIELHGDLARVRCVACNGTRAREAWQRALTEANPDWQARILQVGPDGDTELADNSHDEFVVPGCSDCGDIVKPDVVMFGESVPKERVENASAAVRRVDALLVVGSSLMVYSGFRFVRQASEQQKTVVVLNQGRTRADDLAGLKIEADCGQVLMAAVERLTTIRH